MLSFKALNISTRNRTLLLIQKTIYQEKYKLSECIVQREGLGESYIGEKLTIMYRYL